VTQNPASPWLPRRFFALPKLFFCAARTVAAAVRYVFADEQTQMITFSGDHRIMKLMIDSSRGTASLDAVKRESGWYRSV
jgi:hypothetical protein